MTICTCNSDNPENADAATLSAFGVLDMRLAWFLQLVEQALQIQQDTFALLPRGANVALGRTSEVVYVAGKTGPFVQGVLNVHIKGNHSPGVLVKPQPARRGCV